MEIRRIEGVIPVEAVSRDLPLKLENFSYHEMKKLLSQITKGEQKGKAETEFETLLKAVFLGYEGKGRGKFRVGDAEFTAKLEVDRNFLPGEEVLLRVKGGKERLELSLVNSVSSKLSEVLRQELPKLLKGFLKLPDPQLFSSLLPVIEREYPELLSGFKQFLSSPQVFSPHLLLSLLLVLKPEVRSELERKGVKLPDAASVKELINGIIGLYGLYALLGVVEVPIYVDEGFKGRVFYRSDAGNFSSAFVEVETELGEFKALFRLLGKSISLELWGGKELLKRIDLEEVKERLKALGLEPVLVRAVDREEIERARGELLKGEGISVNFSV